MLASFHTDLARYSRHYSLGWLESWIWRALRTVHNRCAMTLCPSHAMINDLRPRGFERLRYWSRGVDTNRFSPGARLAGLAPGSSACQTSARCCCTSAASPARSASPTWRGPTCAAECSPRDRWGWPVSHGA